MTQFASVPGAAERDLAQYVIKRRLDVSLFGSIYLCCHRSTGHLVAIKKISLRYAAQRVTVSTQQKVRENIDFEVGVHRSLRQNRSSRLESQNILQMLDTQEHGGYLYMIYEYCEKGDLSTIVKTSAKGRLSDSVALKLFRHIVQGVEILHLSGYAHRDLSLKNVLVDSKNVCKICDFGLACYARASCCDTLDKTFYMAPEVSGDTYYDPVRADIWSLGMLLLSMLTGLPSLEVAEESDDSQRVILNHGVLYLFKKLKLANEVSHMTIDLLERILHHDPHKRISIKEILENRLLRHCALEKPSPITGAGQVVSLPIQLNGKDNFTAIALQTIMRN